MTATPIADGGERRKSGWEKRRVDSARAEVGRCLPRGDRVTREEQVRDDERYMHRALELAAGSPGTAPNPRVGAVLVGRDGVLGEGTHLGPGHPHAEQEALRAAEQEALRAAEEETLRAAETEGLRVGGIALRARTEGACLYVNLEPCNHAGRTPPCAPAIARAGIARVIAAIEDPDDRVRGGGFDHLRANGVEVTTGLLAEEARRLNAPYIVHRELGRPLVTLKLALTLDGRLAAADGSSRWITGEEARRRVHARRLAADAILVGAGTVVSDDPRLTIREVSATRQPLRVVVDSSGRLPPTAALFQPDGTNTLIATTERVPAGAQTAWEAAGAEVLVLPAGSGGVDLAALFRDLGRRELLEVYCEGGAGLATSLLREGLVDRLECNYGAVMTGEGPSLGPLGVRALGDGLRFRLDDVSKAGDDVIALYESRWFTTVMRSGTEDRRAEASGVLA